MAFYGRLEKGDREQYLRQALGDDLYERLGEVTMTKTIAQTHEDGRGEGFSNKRDKSIAAVCPKCQAVIFSVLTATKKGGLIHCRLIYCSSCFGVFPIDKKDFRHYCPDCELYFSNVDEICPVCARILSADNIPESEFKGRLQAQLKASETDPNGLDAHEPGAKLDEDKPLAGLLGMFSRALKEVVKVGTFGAKKYSRGGWQHVSRGEIRYTDAMWRHLLEEMIDPIDRDSGMLHAAQLAWNALARLELMLRKKE